MGIREVTQVTVSVNGDLVGLRRGPVMTKQERLIVELASCAIGGTIRRGPMIFLPMHTGAGPCGTLARTTHRCSLRWSIVHLIKPLAAYYAAYIPPMRFGAKPGPRGRRAA